MTENNKNPFFIDVFASTYIIRKNDHEHIIMLLLKFR